MSASPMTALTLGDTVATQLSRLIDILFILAAWLEPMALYHSANQTWFAGKCSIEFDTFLKPPSTGDVPANHA